MQLVGKEGERRSEGVGGRAYDCRTSIVADQTQEARYNAGRSDESSKVDGADMAWAAAKIALDSTATASGRARLSGASGGHSAGKAAVIACDDERQVSACASVPAGR